MHAPSNHAIAFALRMRVKAFEVKVYERIPPLERSGAAAAQRPYPSDICLLADAG